jgi:hypothetical protein
MSPARCQLRQQPARYHDRPAYLGNTLVRADGQAQPDNAGVARRARSCRWGGGPPDRDDDGVLLGLPGVIDAGTPDDVIALPFKRDAADRQVKPELAPDEQDHGGPLVAGRPFRAGIARWMDASGARWCRRWVTVP